MRTSILFVIICLALAGPSALSAPSGKNFLFILADDLGTRDLSVEGSTYYESPNIDRIANSGMRFTNGYAACRVCSPSRASIMTGKYTPRHGITDWIGAKEGFDWKRNTKLLPATYNWQLPAEETTLAEALRQAGYKTFFAGKWHLGDEGSWPEDHGFDINVGGWERGGPAGGYFSPYKNPNLKDGPAGESLPIRLGRETARFIELNKDRKFLAYLSFYSVHGPIQTSAKNWRKYQQKATADPHTGSRFIIDRTLPVRQVQDCPIYGGMIESMDDAVGIVLDKLEELGLDDNTVVVFTSDNGGVSSGDAFSTCNLPFRGGKGRQWEGGIREPYYIKAPGIAKANATCKTPVIGTDFYPTILELAGLELMPDQHVDGVSLVPLLKGKTIAPRDLFWHYPHYGNQGGEPSTVIRSDNFKLIHYWEDGRDELYDISRDISERRDMANSKPEIRTSLRKKLDRWIQETNARLPILNPAYDDKLAAQQEKDMQAIRLPKLEKQHADFVSPDFKPNATWWDSKPD